MICNEIYNLEIEDQEVFLQFARISCAKLVYSGAMVELDKFQQKFQRSPHRDKDQLYNKYMMAQLNRCTQQISREQIQKVIKVFNDDVKLYNLGFDNILTNDEIENLIIDENQNITLSKEELDLKENLNIEVMGKKQLIKQINQKVKQPNINQLNMQQNVNKNEMNQIDGNLREIDKKEQTTKQDDELYQKKENKKNINFQDKVYDGKVVYKTNDRNDKKKNAFSKYGFILYLFNDMQETFTNYPIITIFLLIILFLTTYIGFTEPSENILKEIKNYNKLNKKNKIN